MLIRFLCLTLSFFSGSELNELFSFVSLNLNDADRKAILEATVHVINSNSNVTIN